MDEADEPKDAIGQIRRRPGMYIGGVDSYGMEHLVFELVANSIDQFLAGKVTRVGLSMDGSTISVIDDGPGLPFDESGDGTLSLAECWLTRHHQTPTADGHTPHIHLNASGIGLISVAALSRELKIVSHRHGRVWEQAFHRGHPTRPPVSSASSERGTELTFTPDPEIFEEAQVRIPMLRRRLFDCALLFPGLVLHFHRETFHAPGGLADYVAFLAARPWRRLPLYGPVRSFHLRAEADGVRIEAAAYGTEERGECEWMSWCNGSLTGMHGTHVDGFRDALRGGKWTPAAAAINVIMTHPHFAGPSRDKLNNPYVRKLVRDAVLAKLCQTGAA